MARINELNKRFREKEDIVWDVWKIIYGEYENRKNKSVPYSYAIKYAILSESLWVWTEFHGKDEGCIYWTKEAIERYKNNLENRQQSRIRGESILPKKFTMLTHDHVVPRSIFIKELLDAQYDENHVPLSFDILLAYYERFCIGVMITTEENIALNKFRSTMPSAFFKVPFLERDPWLRYKSTKVAEKLGNNPILVGKTSWTKKGRSLFYNHDWSEIKI